MSFVFSALRIPPGYCNWRIFAIIKDVEFDLKLKFRWTWFIGIALAPDASWSCLRVRQGVWNRDSQSSTETIVANLKTNKVKLQRTRERNLAEIVVGVQNNWSVGDTFVERSFCRGSFRREVKSRDKSLCVDNYCKEGSWCRERKPEIPKFSYTADVKRQSLLSWNNIGFSSTGISSVPRTSNIYLKCGTVLYST